MSFQQFTNNSFRHNQRKNKNTKKNIKKNLKPKRTKTIQFPNQTTNQIQKPKTLDQIKMEKQEKQNQSRKRNIDNSELKKEISMQMQIQMKSPQKSSPNEQIDLQNETLSILHPDEKLLIEQKRSKFSVDSKQNAILDSQIFKHNESWKSEFETFDFSSIEEQLKENIFNFYDQLESEIMSIFTN